MASAAAVPTYHVLGAGAMGCLFAASIAKGAAGGLRVALVTRPRRPPPQAGVIRVTETYRGSDDEGGGAAAPSYEARVDVEENAPRQQAAAAAAAVTGGQPPPIGRLLVLTKAYDALPALTDLAPRLSPESVVVLLSNGMGQYEEIKAEPRLQHVRRWLLGTTTHGALMLSSATSTVAVTEYRVSHTGRGETFLGLPPLHTVPAPSDSLAALKTVLSELSPAKDALGLSIDAEERSNAEASAHAMGRRLWMKLAVNSCINPLTALIRRRNGAVTGEPSIQPLIAALCTEAAAVARAAAAASSSSSKGLSSLPDAAELDAYVRQVAEATAKNESSMLRDVLHGRRTEIDYINGYVVREARRLNLSAPTHEMLLGLVQAAQPGEGGA